MRRPGPVRGPRRTPPAGRSGPTSVVLDLLDGAIWPDADTDRLRAAAATWRTAARSVGLIPGLAGVAVRKPMETPALHR